MNTDVPVGAELVNIASVYSSDDNSTGDNQTSVSVRADNPWTNLSINKSWSHGVLIPGGQLFYNLNYWVNGNIRPQGLLITDTLPISTTLFSTNHGSDVTQVGSGPGYVVWQVTGADNNWGGGFQVVLNVDPAALPGEILTNTVQIEALGPYPDENNLNDNSFQVVKTLNSPGPDLRVSKIRRGADQNRLNYTITFENTGSEIIDNVEILDTLPLSTTFHGSTWFNFDGSRLQGMEDLGTALRWRLSRLNPGEIGYIDVDFDVDDPNWRPAWYTNTVEITRPAGDTNPADNIDVDVFVLGEVIQVDLQVGVNNASIWGSAQPNSTVNIQTADDLYTTQTDPSGGWPLIDIGSIQPGATLTATAGNGKLPVVIHVPDPFSVNIDSTLEQVWGQIGGSANQTVYVDPWGWGYSQQVLANTGDGYTAFYADIPTFGASGEVRYIQTVNAARVTFHRPFHEAYVNLAVDKSGNSVPAPNGNYTYQINYRNQSGDLASNVILTDTLPTGMTYLSDNSGLPVSFNGNQVVWQLGDLGSTNTGFQLHVAVDPGITPGTLLTNTVQIDTPTFEWNYADNTYQWAVKANANDTHLSIGVNATPDDPAPGSQYSYIFNVCNNGTTASSDVVLTATLPISTTYINWIGSGWIQQSIVGHELVLANPSLMGNTCVPARVFVQLDAETPQGWLLEASGVITASNDMETSDNQYTYQHSVGTPRINQWINKYFHSGLLVPGSSLQFIIQYGYDSNFSPGIITITDTLPVSTTFVDAWRNGDFGLEPITPVASGLGYVVFEFDGLTANHYGSDFNVLVQVDVAAIPGTVMTNTVEIPAHDLEANLDDNLSYWSGMLLGHNADLLLSATGGWDLPNDKANLWFTINNTGDLSSGPVAITVTYPLSMSLYGGVSGDWRMTAWQDYPDQHYFTATLSNLESLVGTQINYTTQMQGGGAIPGGQIFTFIADVSVPANDINPANNHASFTLASGPDLFIEKNLSSGTLESGGSLAYYLHMGNRSTANGWNTQGSVLITDTLPTGLTYNGSTWGPVLVEGQIIVWDVGNMGAGWDGGMLVYATITNTAQIGDAFTNGAVIASTNPADVDLNSVDNISSYTFTLMAPQFEINKHVDGSLVAGSLVTYTLSVTNTGNLTGTNVQINDTVPSDLIFSNSNGWMWDGSAVYWTLAQLAPQESVQVWFSAYLPSTAGIIVTNQNYQVTGSDQGIGSPVGVPISFTVIAPPLVAPSDLNATGASCSQIDLTWADNSLDETNFRIERSPDGATNWIEIATVNADVVSYSNTGLSSATKYYYQVRAYRVSDGAFSGYSNIANATTQTCTAILAISPSISTVAVGQDFDLVLEVQAGTQVVDGAAAYLNFDKTYLQVVSITPGSSLPIVLENNYDNATGQLNFAAGVLPPDLNPTGTFTLAKVTFHAQA